MSLTSKQVWSYINENNDDSIFEKALIKTISTKRLARTEVLNEFIFNPKYGKPYKFTIVKEEILLNEKLVNNLVNLILKQLKISSKIPTYNGLEEGNYKERPKIKLEAIIHSLVFYKWEVNKDNISVLDMAADILYRIATLNHPFTNGNKRTALLSCGAFLYSTGLYLYFYKTKSKTKYLNKWEDFMIKIANLKNDGYSEEKAIEYIKNYLQEFLLINFENNVISYNSQLL